MKRLENNSKSTYWLQSVDSDLTGGVFDFLATLSDRTQDEFNELIEGDSGKKRFLKTRTRIFALLLNTKVDTPDKIKRILEIAMKTVIILWQGQINFKKIV